MNIFIVMGGAIALGFLLILALSLTKQRSSDGIGTMAQGALPDFERFIRVCQEILEAHKLEIKEVNPNIDDMSADFYCEFSKPLIGGQFLAHCILRPHTDVVSAADIVELSNAIIQDRLSKGIYITTGRFTAELKGISELAPMEFIDGQELERLCKEHKIPLIIAG